MTVSQNQRLWLTRALVCLSLFMGAARLNAEEGKGEWHVKPDPLPFKSEGPLALKTTIPIAFMGKAHFPTTTGPFVAVNPPESRRVPQVRVYDLRTMKQVGKTLPGKFPRNLTLSPDGAYLAGSAGKGEVHVWSVAKGAEVRTVKVALDKPFARIHLIDFAGKGRLLTISGTPGDFLFQVWDIATGKESARFTHGIEFIHRKWLGFSPGRRYLVLQETDGRRGYHLDFFDLTTGERAGQIEMQGKKDPWGQASGVVFTPDGKELALLWRLNHRDCWAKMMVFDMEKGTKKYERKIDKLLPHIESLWGEGGFTSLQWMPDGQGWVLFGHLLVERETGKVVGKLPPEPGFAGVIVPRRFLDADHFASTVKEGFKWYVQVEALPRAKLDEAIRAVRKKD